MVFERPHDSTAWAPLPRLLLALTAWLSAGWLLRDAATSARSALTVALLIGVGAALLWPRRRRAPPAPELPAPTPHPDSALPWQLRLEHLPVATWRLNEGRLQALSSRARRLLAPGGVRDPAALLALLSNPATPVGPLLLDTERGSERWMLRRQTLALAGQAESLLVLLPLEHELETESLQAWQQLVHILTHEIMNSLTPIQSLSETALQLRQEPGAEAEVELALQAIAKRAASLSDFVRTYRRVSQWPAPQLAPVRLSEVFARLEQAVAPSWAARGGEAKFEAPPSLMLQADEGQLEQALLALLRNAEQATQEQATPRLWVQARQGRGGRLLLSVRDNGPGVPPGLEQRIFLPFFSTREGGQGIGLSVVRQLVHGMGGRVRHVRPLEGGAGFVLVF